MLLPGVKEVMARCVEDHSLETEKPVYVISVLENFSRALLASAISPRQDLTAYLIVLRAAVEAHGAPEVLVSEPRRGVQGEARPGDLSHAGDPKSGDRTPPTLAKLH
jgi:hypothetical protein